MWRKVATLHVHLDESGDLNVSPSGSRYYVFTAAWTYVPFNLAVALSKLRFDLLKRGHNVPQFHATEDIALVRNAVVDILCRYPAWRFASVVAEKAKVPANSQEPASFYANLASMPLRFIFRNVRANTKPVIVYADRPPSQVEHRHREHIQKSIKRAARSELPHGVPFLTYHHHSASNAWLQVADYCCWAVFRKWEKGDDEFYIRLARRLAEPELDVYADSTTRYY